MTQRRIGILGGSFNPPHLGHLEMAEVAKKQLSLTEVWLMVSPQNPLKSTTDMAPLADRLAMCEKLAQGKPWLKVTDIERELDTRYTADTIKKLTEQMPEARIFWLMGDDNLATFHKWHNWEAIAEMVPLVIFRRQGGEAALESPAATALKGHKIPADSNKETPPNWRILGNEPMKVSATEIRDNPQSTGDLIHPEVAAYIKEHNLYAQNA